MSDKISLVAMESDFKEQKTSHTFSGKLYRTKISNNTTDFIEQKPEATPGNVGICFSGGGSIAMIAALGQMRALNEMGFLGKARAISTVSGGSWAVVPFMYLPNEFDDKTFLGEYVADQSTLQLNSPHPSLDLSYAPKGYLGALVTDEGMKIERLLELVGELSRSLTFPNNRIWTYLIAKNILMPFGLAHAQTQTIKKSWFTYNQEMASSIQAIPQNGDLPKTYYTYQQEVDRIRRPYHLCNTSMFITPNANPDEGNMLAPVQCTAVGTGIFASGLGMVASGEPQVGGGLCSSYLFNSRMKNNSGDDVIVNSQRTFSLADITASSSAFFATILPELTSGIDPHYAYWPVANAGKDHSGVTAKFADGGSIEDTGIANLLAYDDIESVVAYVNSLQTVYEDVCNPNAALSNIVVDLWLPPLFGYTPYQFGQEKESLSAGYHLYRDLDKEKLKNKIFRYYKHNQVFPSCEFLPFLKSIYRNAKNNTAPAVYYNAELTVIKNEWFNVNGSDPNNHQPTDRKVKLMVVHYNPLTTWTDKLEPAVAKKLEVYVKKTQTYREILRKKPNKNDGIFPNFVIEQTYMEPCIMNLFAHFTSHIASSQEKTLSEMFQ